MGSPAPSQIFLQRVASPNQLAPQRTYVDSPRSVPNDYSPYSVPVEPQFEFDQSQELYVNVNDDPHIYDLGPTGAIPVEPQFVQPQIAQPAESSNLLFMVSYYLFGNSS
jgi:hypothetical protein